MNRAEKKLLAEQQSLEAQQNSPRALAHLYMLYSAMPLGPGEAAMVPGGVVVNLTDTESGWPESMTPPADQPQPTADHVLEIV